MPPSRKGDALSRQVREGRYLEPRAAVDLRPAAGDRYRVKVETLIALGGKGDVGQQIELSLLQPIETIPPPARHKTKLPALDARDFVQQFDEQTRRTAIPGCIDLRRVFVQPDHDHSRTFSPAGSAVSMPCDHNAQRKQGCENCDGYHESGMLYHGWDGLRRQPGK